LRRKERAVVTKEAIEEIIKKAEVLRVAYTKNQQPYIVPVNFGYKEDAFYFHCANKGKKLEMIESNSNVAFELEGTVELVKGEIPCEFTMTYESVVGTGSASIVYERQEKIIGLNHIMKQYSDEVELKYNKDLVDRIVIVKIDVVEMTGKKSK
jgi:nitroimidazol reductase NimA-like FMN-containing flavoprotein (pyridoxamine 5'-phosphate oxidase superfamily)